MVMMTMMMMMIMIMTMVSVEQRPGWGEHVKTISYPSDLIGRVKICPAPRDSNSFLS